MVESSHSPFTPMHFTRQDDGEDSLFYQYPRLVVHIDDQAIAVVGDLFKEMIPPESSILDLMSSWRSHLPPDLPRAGMVGLGLNDVEMEENPDLDSYIIHDLNFDPRLPFRDNNFDAVTLTVSVQYLVKPVEVFRDVNRVLRPGGPFLVVFSNRMFSTKAVRGWVVNDDEARMTLVATYLHYAGGYEDIRGMCRNPNRGPQEDPVYVVMASKPHNGD